MMFCMPFLPAAPRSPKALAACWRQSSAMARSACSDTPGPMKTIRSGPCMRHWRWPARYPSSPDWRLNVRVGVATGHVVISVSSDEKVPQIVGETPNLAERIKSACPVASVVIDPTTHRLVGANFEMVELGAQLLKGFDASMQVYHVVAPRAVTRFEGRHSAGAVRRLVGRQGDMAMLTSRWTLVAQGEGQVVLLTGQAGIGKSRIASAVAEFVADKDCNVQLYQCSHLYHNTALHPVISRIMRDSEIKLTDKAEVKLTKLRGMLDSELA